MFIFLRNIFHGLIKHNATRCLNIYKKKNEKMAKQKEKDPASSEFDLLLIDIRVYLLDYLS